MRKEMDLSQYRVGIETTPIEVETAKTFEEDVLPRLMGYFLQEGRQCNFP